MKKAFKYFWPAVLWAIFILIICDIHMGTPGGPGLFFEGFDKITHTGLFFTMTVLCAAGYMRHRRARMLTTVQAFFITAAIIVFGGVIELLQLYIFTWRSGDWNDLFADTIGVCMGIFSVIITSVAVNYEKQIL